MDNLFILDVRYFSIGFFPSGNFPSRSSLSARLLDFSSRSSRPPTHPFHPSRSTRCCSQQRLRRPNLTFGKFLPGKLHIWEVAKWEVALGKMPLGKYLTPSHSFLIRQIVYWYCCESYIPLCKYRVVLNYVYNL